MKNLTERLHRIERVSLYMAPADAKITPVKLPENSETVELITGGEVFFEVDAQTKKLGKGTIFWHRAGEETIWQTSPGAPYRCAVFHFSVTDRNRPAPRVSFWNEDADLDRFTSECLNLFHTRELNTEALTLYVYSTLLRHALVSKNAGKQHNYPQPLARALSYVQRHQEEKISVANLAEYSRVSQAQLFRLFRKHLRTTPHQHVISQKLARARTLLAGSHLPIKAIASKCGFESLEVFYRSFRREGGISPGRYRRQHQPYRFPEKV